MAIDHYTRCYGYQYVEVPWIVPSTVNMLTCPDESLLMKISGTTTSLVGSAEQSFLKMDLDGLLPKGKYVACSPCFRIEDSNDGLHFPTFMKVELYRTDRVDAKSMYEMIGDVEAFFNVQNYHSKAEVVRQATSEGVDLFLNGIEIGSYGMRARGSYGMRARGSFEWVYGTGLALPRFTQARAA